MKMLGIIFLMTLVACGEIEPLATIEGKISVGPLCGTVSIIDINKNGNPCGLSNEELDKIYGQYTVVLKNGSNAIVAQKTLDRTGVFVFEVKEGTYVLNIEFQGQNTYFERTKEQYQQSITVVKNEKKTVTMDIGTGIR
jgi:hypothetical protein